MPHGRTNDGGKGDRGAWAELPSRVAAAWAALEPGFRELTATRTVPAEGPIEVTARLRRVGAAVRPPREGGEGAEGGEERTPAGYRESPY